MLSGVNSDLAQSFLLAQSFAQGRGLDELRSCANN